MKIRDLSLTDQGILAQLHAKNFPKCWSEDEFATLLNNQGVCGYLALLEDKPVGFIMAQVVVDIADILTFCILPPYRGVGLGRSLLQALDDLLTSHHVKEVILEVAHDNLPAVMLYHKHGYIPIGKRKNYYQEDSGKSSDAIVMRKIIIP